MVQRSMSYSNHIIDLGAGQRSQEYIHPEPCVFYGSFTAFPHPNVHTIVPAAGNVGNFYMHHLPDHQEGALIYGMSASNMVQQQHPATNVGAAFATSSNHFNPYVAAPSASTEFPVPVNHGLHDWLPFSGTHGVVGNNANNLGMNDPYMESLRGSFKQAPLPYAPGGGVGCVDAGNMGVQGYQVTSSSGGLPSFLHPPIPQGLPHHHHLPPNMHGGHTMMFSPQMTAFSQSHLQNSLSNSTNNPLQGVVPFPPTGFRLYEPHRREFMRTRHHNLPNMRGVAVMEPGYHQVVDAVDQHRDMRLDIDHMSYEELLALEEQIGNVTTGLSEEAIVTNLKTRIFLSSKTPCAVESVAREETDPCVICQNDYSDQEKIGILDCGHEYHEECVKKWLAVKNACPICKSTALSTEE